MKKRNLTAAFLACALCVIAVAGTGCMAQDGYADDTEAGMVANAVAESAIEVDPEVEGEQVQEVEAEAIQEEASEAEAEAAAPASRKSQAETVSKPAAKATQSSTAPSKQQVQSRATAAAPTAKLIASEADDEIQMVIDAIPAASEESAAKNCTITINGAEIDYVDSYGTSSAPETDAGIWHGSDSTTDGSYGYFIGHNYTDFGDVANLEQGSTVSVTDANGDSRDYEVVDSFDVPAGTLWSEVSDRVTSHGESIAMQTCLDEDWVRIVVAE